MRSATPARTRRAASPTSRLRRRRPRARCPGARAARARPGPQTRVVTMNRRRSWYRAKHSASRRAPLPSSTRPRQRRYGRSPRSSAPRAASASPVPTSTPRPTTTAGFDATANRFSTRCCSGSLQYASPSARGEHVLVDGEAEHGFVVRGGMQHCPARDARKAGDRGVIQEGMKRDDVSVGRGDRVDKGGCDRPLLHDPRVELRS